MKFRVLALDYDGTIAFNGVLEPEVRSAIQEARARGIIVILVTGRILADLQKFVSDLTFVDAVVAENGGVMAFPGGQTRTIGFPPPAAFLNELAKEGVPYECRECVVETDANWAANPLCHATGMSRDLQLGAYVLVTYHPAELNPEICKSIEGVITTRLTEVHEQKSLLRLCHTQHGTASGLAMVNNLKLGEAVLFPGIEEAHGCMQRFTVLPRLTPHILPGQ